jgi:hypothetical protein
MKDWMGMELFYLKEVFENRLMRGKGARVLQRLKRAPTKCALKKQKYYSKILIYAIVKIYNIKAM